MTYYNLNTLIKNTIDTYYGTGTTVQFSEGDIYAAVNWNENSYPAFNLFLNNMVQNSNTITFNLTLYYIDILLQDRSNKLTIQSDGIEVLKSIIASIDQIYQTNDLTNLLSPINYTVFTEKFTDECAGAFVTFGLQYPYTTDCD